MEDNAGGVDDALGSPSCLDAEAVVQSREDLLADSLRRTRQSPLLQPALPQVGEHFAQAIAHLIPPAPPDRLLQGGQAQQLIDRGEGSQDLLAVHRLTQGLSPFHSHRGGEGGAVLLGRLPRQDLPGQFEDLLVDGPIARDNAPQVAYPLSEIVEGGSLEIGNRSASFPKNRFRGTGVPEVGLLRGVKVEVSPPLSEHPHLQSNAAGLNDVGNAEAGHDLVDDGAVVGAAHRRRHPRGQAFGVDLQSLGRPRLLDERSSPDSREEEPVDGRMVDHPELGDPGDRQTDLDREFWNPLDELLGSVHRVDHPDPVARQAGAIVRGLFREDPIPGEEVGEAVDKVPVGVAVGRCHWVVLPFPFDRRRLLVVFEKNLSGFPGKPPRYFKLKFQGGRDHDNTKGLAAAGSGGTCRRSRPGPPVPAIGDFSNSPRKLPVYSNPLESKNHRSPYLPIARMGAGEKA